MIVRGWLMIGDLSASKALPPERNNGWFTGGVTPDASQFRAGDYVVWTPPGSMAVCLVCVEVPIG